MTNIPSFRSDIADRYDRLLVPMIFESYAEDIAARVATLAPRRVLEVAAGTGVVTRAMDRRLDAAAMITATDLSADMLARAASVGTQRVVEWRQADAQALPFPDKSFDVLVCQFGVMFFPDKARAFSEVRRVLRDHGTLIFSAWDRIEDNEFADSVETAMAPLFPDKPPHFMRELPHGYFDATLIARHLEQGGFTAQPIVDTIASQSRAASPRVAAEAYCLGTPIRAEIEARDPARLPEAIDAAAAALTRRFGPGAIAGKIQAHVVTIAR